MPAFSLGGISQMQSATGTTFTLHSSRGRRAIAAIAHPGPDAYCGFDRERAALTAAHRYTHIATPASLIRSPREAARSAARARRRASLMIEVLVLAGRRAPGAFETDVVEGGLAARRHFIAVKSLVRLSRASPKSIMHLSL